VWVPLNKLVLFHIFKAD